MMSQEADPGELAVPASRAGELSVFLQSLITAATVPLRDKLFLNIKEAARFAGLPKATIRRLIHWNNSIRDRSDKNPRRQAAVSLGGFPRRRAFSIFAIAHHRRDCAAEGQAVSQHQRSGPLRRAAQSHDPPFDPHR